MSTRTVHSQTEFDAAVEAGADEILICSESDAWIMVTAHGSSKIGAYRSSKVKVYGLSAVMAFDSSTVKAYNSSTVSAFDFSAVEAYGSSEVKTFGSSTALTFGSSTALAYGSSEVKAYGSSAVRAYNYSTVKAHDSTAVDAHGSSTVTASKFVTVHLFSDDVTIDGSGHIVDVTNPDLEPLPPVIPDDCKEVRASSDEDPLRSVWIRDARAVDAWVTVTVLGEVMRAHTNDLIDPKPVPKEES